MYIYRISCDGSEEDTSSDLEDIVITNATPVPEEFSRWCCFFSTIAAVVAFIASVVTILGFVLGFFYTPNNRADNHTSTTISETRLLTSSEFDTLLNMINNLKDTENQLQSKNSLLEYKLDTVSAQCKTSVDALTTNMNTNNDKFSSDLQTANTRITTLSNTFTADINTKFDKLSSDYQTVGTRITTLSNTCQAIANNQTTERIKAIASVRTLITSVSNQQQTFSSVVNSKFESIFGVNDDKQPLIYPRSVAGNNLCLLMETTGTQCPDGFTKRASFAVITYNGSPVPSGYAIGGAYNSGFSWMHGSLCCRSWG